MKHRGATLRIVYTLLIVLAALLVTAVQVKPPDSAPPGCWTQITQTWPDPGMGTGWGVGHFKGSPLHPEPNCGMEIQFELNGKIVTHRYTGEGDAWFDDGSHIENVPHYGDNGEVFWESIGWAPPGLTLTRGSIFNGDPVEIMTPVPTSTPASPEPTATPVPIVLPPLPKPTEPCNPDNGCPGGIQGWGGEIYLSVVWNAVVCKNGDTHICMIEPPGK